MDRCAYCLAELSDESRTVDHVIARSWYPPSNTPIAKWKVPACRSCNNRLSAIEGRALQRLTLTIDVTDPNLKKLYEKASRGWRASQGSTFSDQFHKGRNHAALLRSTLNINASSSSKALPFSRRNYWLGSRTAIKIEKDDIHALVEKWVRGIHFCEFGLLIPAGYEITPYFITDEGTHDLAETMKSAPTFRKGQYVEAQVLSARSIDPNSAIYRIKLWKSFEAYADVSASNRSGSGP